VDESAELLELISPFEPKNTDNADKTGLFFRALPTKSLMGKGENCIGGKMSKERLIVLLCGNMVVEMEKQQNQNISRT
jgi:hypothetical protein